MLKSSFSVLLGEAYTEYVLLPHKDVEKSTFGGIEIRPVAY